MHEGRQRRSCCPKRSSAAQLPPGAFSTPFPPLEQDYAAFARLVGDDHPELLQELNIQQVRCSSRGERGGAPPPPPARWIAAEGCNSSTLKAKSAAARHRLCAPGDCSGRCGQSAFAALPPLPNAAWGPAVCTCATHAGAHLPVLPQREGGGPPRRQQPRRPDRPDPVSAGSGRHQAAAAAERRRRRCPSPPHAPWPLHARLRLRRSCQPPTFAVVQYPVLSPSPHKSLTPLHSGTACQSHGCLPPLQVLSLVSPRRFLRCLLLFPPASIAPRRPPLIQASPLASPLHCPCIPSLAPFFITAHPPLPSSMCTVSCTHAVLSVACTGVAATNVIM